MENDPSVLIRGATLQDLSGILEIEQKSFSGDRFSRRQFRYLITRAKASFMVLCREELVLAYSILLLPQHLKIARIYSIAAHPEAKGKGYGRLLMQHNIQLATTKGYREIRLEVREDNTAAISLYKSLGFRQIGLKQQYYEDGMHARIFCIEIQTAVS